MPKTLVVVESPAKAKTIKKYLGNGYEVLASKGHVRDLPKKLGIDVAHDFRETYEVIEAKEKVLGELKTAVKIRRAATAVTQPGMRHRRATASQRLPWLEASRGRRVCRIRPATAG